MVVSPHYRERVMHEDFDWEVIIMQSKGGISAKPEIPQVKSHVPIQQFLIAIPDTPTHITRNNLFASGLFISFCRSEGACLRP